LKIHCAVLAEEWEQKNPAASVKQFFLFAAHAFGRDWRDLNRHFLILPVFSFCRT